MIDYAHFMKSREGVTITNGQYHDHFRPTFPLNLASATAKANFDRTITLPIDMDAWDDYLLAFSDIDMSIDTIQLTLATPA